MFAVSEFAGSASDKAAVRARVRAARARRGEAERAHAAAAVARHARDLLGPGDTRVAGYLSLPAEPGTGPLLAALVADGLRVLVPRVVGTRLEWVRWSPATPTVAGPFGIREPVGPDDAVGLGDVDVVVLPALAVDRSGVRLGQGGGYYDRALAGVRPASAGGPLRVAVVFDDEVLDVVPAQPHDVVVDAALTPSGVVRFTR